tara:strand:+ start:134 stop:571 length:438 start_codon:yes stop_codon:yes gene_type:complete
MWVFGPILAIIFSGLFQDEIISAVEKKYYSLNKIETSNKLFKEIKFNLNLFLKIFLFNLFIIPFIFIPPIYFILYWVVNGYLISYEYFNIVKIRYNNHNHNQNKYLLLIFGIVISILFTIPVINFFVPAIGIASTVHIYNSLEEN